MASNTFLATTRLIDRFGSFRSVSLNRLDELDAMGPTAPSETVNSGPKHVWGHNSAQRAFQKVSGSDSDSAR